MKNRKKKTDIMVLGNSRQSILYILLGGTSGGAGSDAGSGATLSVSGSDIPLLGSGRKSEFVILVIFCKYLAPTDDSNTGIQKLYGWNVYLYEFWIII